MVDMSDEAVDQRVRDLTGTDPEAKAKAISELEQRRDEVIAAVVEQHAEPKRLVKVTRSITVTCYMPISSYMSHDGQMPDEAIVEYEKSLDAGDAAQACYELVSVASEENISQTLDIQFIEA